MASLRTNFSRALLCWDCVSAGLGASGDCSLAEVPLSRPLRGRFAVVQNQAGQHFLGRHVTAHEGHPWNELADSAANRFRAGDCSPTCPSLIAEGWAWAPVIFNCGMPPIYTVGDGHAWSVAKDAGIGPLPEVAGLVVTCFLLSCNFCFCLVVTFGPELLAGPVCGPPPPPSPNAPPPPLHRSPPLPHQPEFVVYACSHVVYG